MSISERMEQKLLSSLTPINRRDLCSHPLKHLNYEIEVFTHVFLDEPNFYEFDYGHGLKKKHFVLNCSLKNKMFLHLVNSEKEGARIEVLLRKSKLWDKPVATKSNEPRKLPAIIGIIHIKD